METNNTMCVIIMINFFIFLKLCSFPLPEKNFSSFSVKNLFRKLMFLWVIKAPVESALTTSNAMDR